MPVLSLDQKLKRVEVDSFEIKNDIVFNYFDKLSADERGEQLLRAVYIGVLALMEDRLSSFLSTTSNELGTRLESLKMIFEMKKELFYKSAVKGVLAEKDIAEFLTNFFDEQRLPDRAILTGSTSGVLPRNKTGDIVCYVDGRDNVKIAIECKFDKSIKLGSISTKDIFSRKSDTVWGQLIEAQANRDAQTAIIVLDVSLVDNTVLSSIQNVRYIPSIGFVSIINSQSGDYSNLAIAYMLARDIALSPQSTELDRDLLAIIVNRLVKDIGEILQIRNLVMNNIENNKAILLQLDKILLLMEFNQKYLGKFLKDGLLSKQDMLNFYAGEEVSEKFRIIEKDIKEI